MLKIIYEDDDILALDKPVGLVVDRSETQQNHTLEDLLKDYYDRLVYHNSGVLERMGIVHRLDKDTSGVLLVAKTQEALENLQAQFKERKTKKEYIALVHGLVEKSGRVEGNIGRNPGNREKFTVLPGTSTSEESKLTSEVSGRWAVTEYNPISNFKLFFKPPSAEQISNLQSIFNDLNKIQKRRLERMKYNQFSLLKCYPLTGRTHQIRVHLKYITHPIVADEKYAGRKIYRLDKRWCPRMFLHAKTLGFFHPGSGEWMEVESPLAEDLRKVLEFLK